MRNLHRFWLEYSTNKEYCQDKRLRSQNLAFLFKMGFFSKAKCVINSIKVKVKVSRVRLFVTPIDYTVHGIIQARILEWVAFPFSRESFQPRDQTQVSCIAKRFFTSWGPGKPKNTGVNSLSLLQQICPTQELSRISCIAGKLFTNWAIKEALHSVVCQLYFNKTGRKRENYKAYQKVKTTSWRQKASIWTRFGKHVEIIRLFI